MSLLMHAQVEVSGECIEREAYRLKVAGLLLDEALLGIEERHTAERLVYDLKVEGGIPFPLFVVASEGLSGLMVAIEWVNPRTDERGSATIVDGRLQTAAVGPRVDGDGRGERQSYVCVDALRGLRLAFACVRISADDYHGYAIDGEQDAVFSLKRDAGKGRAVLLASTGAPEWSERWDVDLARGCWEHTEVAPPRPIDADQLTSLTALAEAFAQEWLWFSTRAQDEIAIERARYRDIPLPERAANVRAAKLRRMGEGGAKAGELRQWSDLGPEAEWVRTILETCWLRT